MKYSDLHDLMFLNEAKVDDVLSTAGLKPEEEDFVRAVVERLVNKSKYVEILVKHIKNFKPTEWGDFISTVKYLTNDNVKSAIEEFAEKYNFIEEHKQLFPNIDVSKITHVELMKICKEAKEKYEEDKLEKETNKVVKILDNEDFLIVKPLSWKASCKYGAGAKWCVSMKTDQRYWDDYIKKGNTFYFVINKKLPDDNNAKKVAVQVHGDGTLSYWDARDVKVPAGVIQKDGGYNIEEFSKYFTGVDINKHFNEWLEKYKLKLDDMGFYNQTEDVDINIDLKNLPAKVYSRHERSLLIQFGAIKGNFTIDMEDMFHHSLQNLPTSVAKNMYIINSKRSRYSIDTEVGGMLLHEKGIISDYSLLPKALKGYCFREMDSPVELQYLIDNRLHEGMTLTISMSDISTRLIDLRYAEKLELISIDSCGYFREIVLPEAVENLTIIDNMGIIKIQTEDESKKCKVKKAVIMDNETAFTKEKLEKVLDCENLRCDE